MSTTLLHPVMLAAIEAERRKFPGPGPVAAMLALVLGAALLSLTLG